MKRAFDALRRSRPTVLNPWIDVSLDAIGVIVAVVGLHGAWAAGSPSAAGLILLASLAAAVRHRLPLMAGIAGVVLAAAALPLSSLSLTVWSLAQICLMSLALVGRRRAAIVVATVLAAVLLAGALVLPHGSLTGAGVLVLPLWTAAVLGVGIAVRAQREQLLALAAAAASAQSARTSDIERHVSDERLRIARDLHDSVAHSMAVISVHAGAAGHALPGRPEDAADSIRNVQRASRTVLNEMQQLLRLLRTADPGADNELGTTPTVSSLIDAAERAGMRVNANVPAPADLASLDPAIARSLTRIVQELLTNAQRYSIGVVDLGLTRDENSVQLHAVNRAQTKSEPASSGFGLIGMSERVQALGGVMQIENARGMFSVVINIPLEAGERQDT